MQLLNRICDRCKTSCDDDFKQFRSVAKGLEEFDLCPPCLEAFRQWIGIPDPTPRFRDEIEAYRNQEIKD